MNGLLNYTPEQLNRLGLLAQQDLTTGTINPSNPNMVDKAQGLLAQGFMKMGYNPRDAYAQANKWISTQGDMGAADFVPLAGDLIGAQDAYDMGGEAKNAFNREEYLKALGYGAGSAATGVLSGLGVLGTIAPPLDKAIDAARVGVKKATGLLDDVDELGFYSPTERLATTLQPKGTGQQYLGILAKGDGQGSRIQEEMQDMGLDNWLQGKGKVSRDEVLDYIGDNRLRYGKTVGRNQWSQSDEDILAELEDRASRKVRTPPDTDFNPKYQQYSQEGGTNYQENLLTVPSDSKSLETYEIDDGGVKYYGVRNLENLDASGNPRKVYEDGYDIMTNTPERALDRANKILGRNTNYQSPHYDQSNIGLTTRTQSMNTPQGDSVHLMDELQSDWHSDGRTKGYGGTLPQTDDELRAVYRQFLIDAGMDENIANNISSGDIGSIRNNFNMSSNSKTVPNAPAKQSWMNQGIKKEINQTIADGRDYFAWTGGKIQIDRYEDVMRQNVDEIIYEMGDDGKYFIDVSKDGKNVYENSGLNIEEVEKVFGKDITKKIKNGTGDATIGTRPDAKTLSGDDLSIGGEGMKNFYDRDVKKRTEKIIKKLDPNAKVEIIELDNGNKVWGVKITDKMRDKVKTEGMPLYSVAPIAGAGLLGATAMSQQENQQQPTGILQY
jgi:hypothetical protein